MSGFEPEGSERTHKSLAEDGGDYLVVDLAVGGNEVFALFPRVAELVGDHAAGFGDDDQHWGDVPDVDERVDHCFATACCE